jgi:hypothetical protein
MPADFQPAGEIKKRMVLGMKIDIGSHECAKNRTRLKLADGPARLKPEKPKSYFGFRNAGTLLEFKLQLVLFLCASKA